LRQYLSSYQDTIHCHFKPFFLEPRDFYVDPAKVAKSSHYALIPTENIPNLLSLSPDERLIYEAVVKRSILMFAADCRYQTTTVQLENKGQVFQTKGKRTLEPGWIEWSDLPIKKDVELQNYSKAELTLEIETREQKF